MKTQLSPRERQVYALVSLGLSNKEIGAKLGITTNTVKAFMSRLRLKLGATSLRRERRAAEFHRAIEGSPLERGTGAANADAAVIRV